MSPSARARSAVLCAALSALTVAGMAGTAVAFGEPAPTTSSRACAGFPTQVHAQAALTGAPRLDRDGDGVACGRWFGAATPAGGVITATSPTP